MQQFKLFAIAAIELALAWRLLGAAIVLYNGAKMLLVILLAGLFCRAPFMKHAPKHTGRVLSIFSVWLLNLLSLTLVSFENIFVCYYVAI